MAIYHFRAQVLTRGTGRSAIAAAAYRHRTKMTDEQIGTSWSYDRTQDLAHEEITLPADTPQWAQSLLDNQSVAEGSESFWNAVEAHEKRADAQLAREIVVALPEELSHQESVALAREFIETAFAAKGMVADWVFHEPTAADQGGRRNPHLHIMTTLRPLTEQGFGGKKVPELDDAGQPVRQSGKIKYQLWAGDKAQLSEWRAEWAEVANRHLALAGHDVRIDHRSYKDQGIALEATVHLGPAASAVRSKLGELDKSHHVAAVRERNAEAIRRNPATLLSVITSEKSVFDERDVARLVARYTDSREAFDRFHHGLMTSKEIVTLVPEIRHPETGVVITKALYSTPEMVYIERRMAGDASLLAITPTHGVGSSFVELALSRRSFLAEEQKEAVRHVTGSKRIAAVVGFAGAGKSTMLDAAREAWEAEGYRVHGAALAGKAAEELEKSSGIKGRTLASWELAWSKGKDLLQKGDVLVIDEAGMVSSKQLANVIRHVQERGAKAVLVGDAMQLQPIEAGAAFRAITERIGYVELEGVRRQKEDWAKAASIDFARGRTDKAIGAYLDRGQVRRNETREDAKLSIVMDWMAVRDAGSTLILAHTNKDVHALNQGVREALKAGGELQREERFTTARGQREFAAGDRIIFLKNDRELGVKNGQLGTVERAGDGRVWVGLDNGRKVEVNQIAYNNIDHGYAATVHKSQGSTVDRTFVLATPGMDQHLTYVAMSRHRESATLYAAKEDFGSRAVLVERLGRSGAKETTLDYESKAEFLERRGFESWRTIRPSLAAFVEKQKAWIADRSTALKATWERLVAVQSRAIEQERAAPAITPSQPLAPARIAAPSEPLFAAVTTFHRTVEDTARENARSGPAYVARLEDLRAIAAKIYREPSAAAERIEATFLKAGSAEKVAAVLTASPERAGELRGSPRLLDGPKARQERDQALASLRGLGVSLQQLETALELSEKQAVVEETRRRQRMGHEVADLSTEARTVLAKIEQERARGAEPYRTALSDLARRPEIASEITHFSIAIEKRFGPHGLPSEGREVAAEVRSEERSKLGTLRPVVVTAARTRTDLAALVGTTIGRSKNPQFKP